MLTLQELSSKMEKLDNWVLDGNYITKEIEFLDSKRAILFVNMVSEITEKYNHHPEILINVNVVRLSLTTHSEKGLTDEDFKVAEEIDKIENNVDEIDDNIGEIESSINEMEEENESNVNEVDENS